MRLVVCVTLLAIGLALPSAALGVGWLLDPSFGLAGYTTEPSTALEDRVQGMAVQADGRVIAGGYSHNPGVPVNAPDWITAKLIRYDVDGTLDASFGVGGVVSGVPVTGLYAVGRPTVMDDGRILWGGIIDVFVPSFDIVSFVCRFEADGTLDTTFGDNGVVLVPDYWLVPNAPVARPDGRVLLSGWKWNVGTLNDRSVAIVQLAADGTLDPTFGGGDGIVDSDLVAGQADYANDLLLEPDGRIVVAGDTVVYPGPVFDVFVARYLADGDPDPSFGGGTGFVVTDGGADVVTFSGIERRPDGRYVAGGYSYPTGLLLVGYASDGTLDPSVGGSGVVVTVLTGGETTTDIALDAQGRVITAGGSDGVVLVRQLADGSLDPDFGDGGVIRWTPNGPFGGPTFFDVAVHTNGKIVAAGTFYPDEFVVARFSDGDYDVCPTAPRAGCTTAVQPAAARLQLATGTSPDRQKVSWKLTDGDASTPADLADPLTADDYTVCLYDDADALLWEAIAPAAGTCRGRPCWSTIPSVGGVKYRDGGAAHGITSLVVRPGIAGKTRLAVKARSELRLPALPLGLPVRAQLQMAHGGCFESTFSTTGATANTAAVFKGRSD